MSISKISVAKTVAFAVALSVSGVAFAQDSMNESSGPPASDPQESAAGMDISASLSASTDYIFRGVSQTSENPAVFAAVNVTANGFYAGVGTENVDFLGIDQEYDLWGGYVFKLGGKTSLDVGVVRYGYIDSPVNIDTVEVKAALSTTVGKTSLGAAAYWTPDYFGSNDDAVYGELTASQAVTDKLSLSGGIGYQQISGAKDYTTWNLGASYAVLPGARVDVRYYDTDTNAFGKIGGSRLVGSFNISF